MKKTFEDSFFYLMSDSFYFENPVMISDNTIYDDMYELTHEPYKGKTSISIPAMIAKHYHSNEEMSFEAQTFHLNVLSSKKVMGDYYEGKMFYDYVTKIQDEETGNIFIITLSYLNDDLTDIALMKAKPTVKKNKQNIQASGKTKGKKTKPVIKYYQHLNNIFKHLFVRSGRDVYPAGFMDDEFYDMLHEGVGEYSIYVPDFSGSDYDGENEKDVVAKTYQLKVLSSNKEMIDYCEGKSQYEYVTKLKDLEAGDIFHIALSYYNDTMTDVYIK